MLSVLCVMVFPRRGSADILHVCVIRHSKSKLYRLNVAETMLLLVSRVLTSNKMYHR